MDRQPESKSTTIGVGAIAIAFGGYFILVSFGLLPPPDGKNPHDPLWVAFGAGLAFLLGGIAVVTRAFAGDVPADGELPPTAPRWIRATQYVVGLAVLVCLAAIGTWIAFGPGSRAFSASGPFFGGSIGEAIGRTVFGIGAVATWLALLAVATRAARKLLGRGNA